MSATPTFTLACEKLVEQHGYRLSVETLRQWMIAEGLWKPKKRKAARIHQRRPRRPCPGELVQIDGSPHDCFPKMNGKGFDRVHDKTAAADSEGYLMILPGGHQKNEQRASALEFTGASPSHRKTRERTQLGSASMHPKTGKACA